MEDVPFAIPVSKIQLIKAIKAGGGKTENNIGDANYPAYFQTKRSKAVYLYLSVFRKDQARKLIASKSFVELCAYKLVIFMLTSYIC